MGEPIEFAVFAGTLRLKTVTRRGATPTACRDLVGESADVRSDAALDFLGQCCELQGPAQGTQGDTLHSDASGTE